MITADVGAHLRQRRTELVQRLADVRAGVRPETEPLSTDAEGRAIQGENDEVLAAIEAAVEAELGQLDAALLRLAQGRYGVCGSCKQPIDPQRLASVPYAELCSDCAERC